MSERRPRPIIEREPPVVDGRLPPHNLDAEAAVLSACLDGHEVFDRVAAIVSAESFYSKAHQLIFGAMLAIRLDGRSLDLVTLANELRACETIEAVGGTTYLGVISDATPAVANVEEHADIVADKARRRRFIQLCRRFAAEGYDSDTAPGWIDESLEELSETMHQRRTGDRAMPLLEVGEIFAPLPPIPYVVAGLDMAPGPPIMIAGKGYTAKTFAAQDLALAVATGGKAWDKFNCAQGRVVHLDYEQGRHLTLQRYQRLARARGIDARELEGQLAVSVLPLYLEAPRAMGILARVCEGAKLCIIDSYKAAWPSIEENDSAARVPLDRLGRLSEDLGCAFMVLHHARKGGDEDGDAIRGSGALRDGCSSILIFRGRKGEPVRVTHDKAKLSGKEADDFVLELEDVIDDDGIDPRWGVRVTAGDAELAQAEAEEQTHAELDERVLAYIRDNPNCSKRQVRYRVRGNNAGIFAAIDVLEQRGLVRDTGGGRRSCLVAI